MNKFTKVMFVLSLIFVSLGAVCFVVPPIISQFIDPSTVVFYVDQAIMSAFTFIPGIFNFAEIGSFGLEKWIALITLAVFIVLWLAHFIACIARKKGGSIVASIFTLLEFAVIYLLVVMLGCDKAALDGVINGGVTFGQVAEDQYRLVKAYLATFSDGKPMYIGILGFASMGLAGLGLVFLVLMNIVNIFTKKVGEKKAKSHVVTAESFADVNDFITPDEARSVLTDSTEEEVSVPENANQVKEEKKEQPTIIQQFFTPYPGFSPADAAQIAKKEEKVPEAEPKKDEEELSVREITSLINAEVRAALLDDETKQNIVTSIEPSLRSIVREEILAALKELSLDKNVVVAPVVSNVVSEATEEEPVEEAVENEEAPLEEESEVEENEVVTPKAKIVRIPFSTRIENMREDMRANFNELKADILSYGVKSRVSNSGDTFRLHTKTYVKMTIAGNSLKLYFALDPNDYKDSTLPISDASSKAIYKETPLVFKVKSPLSVRRAKSLIADAMAKDGLVQKEIVNKDYIQEIIDAKSVASEEESED